MANYMYLTDQKLSSKITILRAKGVNDNIIKNLLEKGLLTGTIEDINKNIEIIENNYGELNEQNLQLLKKDLTTYFKRIVLLKSLGIELDNNELRNFLELLVCTPYLEADIEILKHYMIRIARKNGKYALDIFWKSPIELIKTLDDMFEANLENIIINNPETISLNTEELLKRVKYCNLNNIPIFNNEKENTENYIINPFDFAKKFTDANIENIKINKPNNTNIFYNNKYIDALNVYYQNNMLATVKISEDQIEDNRIVTELFEKNINVKILSPNTYSFSGIIISKKKVERNIIFLIDFIKKERGNIQGLEKEIILLALIYNLRADENTINMITNLIMEINQSIGGTML